MGVIIKNTIKASLVNYIGVVIGIISVLYLQTMILSPSQIGKIQLIIDKTYLFSPFILFGLVGAVARFSHIFKSKKGYSGFLSWSLITPFVSYLIACILFYVFAEDREYIFEFYIILFFSVYINLFESALTTKAKIVFPLVLRAIVVRLIMILNLVFYFFNLYSFDGFITGFVITHFSHFAILACS